jgi:replicative DNA helicase
MGKSALGAKIALNVARQTGQPVGFYSLEMDSKDILKRLIQSESRVPLNRHYSQTEVGEVVAKLSKAFIPLSESPLYVFQGAGLTLNGIQSGLMQLKHQNGGKLALGVVDYLQLMDNHTQQYTGNRNLELSAISRGLKQLALRLNIPIIALAQLNRAVESRGDKRPVLSDLRDSGAIEQDADVVMFINREDYYDADLRQGEAEIIIRKNRHGRAGEVALHFEPDLTRFTDAIG